MPNRTTDNPFTPRGTLSREHLERYLRGELSPAAQHEVELRLEGDPLLREAVEGLRMPGAMAAAARLDAHRPTSARFGGRMWAVLCISLVAVVIALWLGQSTYVPPPVQPAWLVSEALPVPATPLQQAAFETELDEATALPESLRSAFRGTDRFVQPMDTIAPLSREDPPVRVEALQPAPVEAPPVPVEKPKGVPQPPPSRKLLFFFDLKLVHPSELYPIDPVIELAEGSVDARFSDAQAKADALPMERNVPYDRYFRTAMGKFTRGDRQGCLEDLFVVLEEYPEDVNALFYAGLCCYDLGLFPRAANLLDRARKHKVDTFVEEAEWYTALATDRAYGRVNALPLLQAVADRMGFYAPRAIERIALK